MLRFIVPAGLAALLAACSSTPASQREAAALARYQSSAGEPVASFSYFSLNSWTPLGDEHLAVWTRPNQAWLLRVGLPCQQLPWAMTIGLEGPMKRVSARFDHIRVDGERCRIEEIRPIDVARLKQSEADARRTIESVSDAEPQASGAT